MQSCLGVVVRLVVLVVGIVEVVVAPSSLVRILWGPLYYSLMLFFCWRDEKVMRLFGRILPRNGLAGEVKSWKISPSVVRKCTAFI